MRLRSLQNIDQLPLISIIHENNQPLMSQVNETNQSFLVDDIKYTIDKFCARNPGRSIKVRGACGCNVQKRSNNACYFFKDLLTKILVSSSWRRAAITKKSVLRQTCDSKCANKLGMRVNRKVVISNFIGNIGCVYLLVVKLDIQSVQHQ